MPVRPGDSAPDFHRIEQNLNRAEDDVSDDQDLVAETPATTEKGLSDSHILQSPPMIPHHSDGTTDVLEKGRGSLRDEAEEETEPLFPRHSAARATAADEDATVELKRAGQRSASRAVDPDDAPTTIAPSPLAVVPPTASVPSPAPSSEPAAAVPAPQAARNQRGPGGLLFLLLLSYASAVTIGLVYLLMTRQAAGPDRHQLEDLRDPVDEEGTVRIYQRGVDLPPGHTLQLAGKQRFGNILVEPLRVTQGPVEFMHYSKDNRKTKPPTEPVYKLWLRLTNESADQQIAPLDALLMYKRELNTAGELVSNTFVAPVGKAEEGPVVFSYPAAQNSEWDMLDQELGRVLAPGESMETYIPSDLEGLELLSESSELMWRFHLRKGYAPSGAGVTTLVEVMFSPEDVEEEPQKAKPVEEQKQRTRKA